MKFLTLLALLFSAPAFAGFQGINGTTSLGIFNKLTCSTGVTCTKVGSAFSVVSSPSLTSALTLTGLASTSGILNINANNNASNADKWQIAADTATDSLIFYNKTSGSYVAKYTLTTGGNVTVAGTETVTGAFTPAGGIAASATTKTIFAPTWSPGVATNATSATPSATVVYMTQLWIPHNVTLTGVGILNAATVGTNKWIVALFDSAGNVLANSALAGVLTAGASVFQKVPFTGTYALVGPRTVWVGAYMNGVTDRYYAIPSIGQMGGLAGSVSGQTFGTVAAVTLPTTFTADVAPVVYVY